MLRSALLSVCALTILAVAYLTSSVLVIRPPRANLAAWLPLAGLLIAQGVLTFVAAARPAGWSRLLVTAGGAGLIAVGSWMVRGTIISDHFEGYALVLGSMLVVQGIATVGVFFGRRNLPATAS